MIKLHDTSRKMVQDSYVNRPIQTKCVASVSNCGLGLETAMAPTVNRGWHFSLSVNNINVSANYFILHEDRD